MKSGQTLLLNLLVATGMLACQSKIDDAPETGSLHDFEAVLSKDCAIVDIDTVQEDSLGYYDITLKKTAPQDTMFGYYIMRFTDNHNGILAKNAKGVFGFEVYGDTSQYKPGDNATVGTMGISLNGDYLEEKLNKIAVLKKFTTTEEKPVDKKTAEQFAATRAHNDSVMEAYETSEIGIQSLQQAQEEITQDLNTILFNGRPFLKASSFPIE